MMKSSIDVLIGQTLSSIKQEGNEEIIFKTVDGQSYRMYHYQHCCEIVTIEDVCGNLQNLVGSPITMAEEVSNYKYDEGDNPDSHYGTWTFYRLATAQGYVTIRWYGESNGFYSERVDFALAKK